MAMKLSERRSGLDTLLRSIVKQRCGSENVYYQPPANLRMKYPCICYKLEKIRSPKADDRVYRQTFHYSVTVIDTKPDSEMTAAISKVMGDDYDYTPQIVPVVDLTNVLEGADEIDNAFASTRSLSLDGDISRNLANQIDAEVQLQNGVKNKGNDDTLNAINGLAGHMDGIVDSIRGMKMTIDGRKTIGYIDNRMGQIAAAKVR